MSKEKRIVINEYTQPPCVGCACEPGCDETGHECSRYKQWSEAQNSREMNWSRSEAVDLGAKAILKSLAQQVHGSGGEIDMRYCAEAVIDTLLGVK